MIDVLVIGAGLSGLMAAYTAARANLNVKVIAKGLGAMHWGAGAVDVLGYLPGESLPVRRPLDAIPTLAGRLPGHPYTLLGVDAVREALDSFAALTAEIGLPYSGAAQAGDNLLLPSPAGAPRPVYLAPKAQLAGDLGQSAPLLIIGFTGMRDFYPHLIAENLNKLGHRARAVQLPFDLLTDRRDSSTVHLAQELDQVERRSRLAAALKKQAQAGERIGLPAILGLNDHANAHADLERQVGAPIFEIPTLPPSVPGVRLFQALRRRLQSMDVRVEPGMEVIGAEATLRVNGTAGRVQWVESETSSRPLKHRARNYVLATGGVLGGGFNSDANGRVWDPIFDLPLTAPQNRTQWFHASFLAPEGHPVFRGGVAVNAQLQPIDGHGAPLYANLWAVGDALAHCDTLQERSLEGNAIATGAAAANIIVNCQ